MKSIVTRVWIPRARSRGKKVFGLEMAAYERRELQALADCYGISLRAVMNRAVWMERCRIEGLIGIKASEAVKIPREVRREAGLRRWQLQRALGFLSEQAIKSN
jgi:hypothetical protein